MPRVCEKNYKKNGHKHKTIVSDASRGTSHGRRTCLQVPRAHGDDDEVLAVLRLLRRLLVSGFECPPPTGVASETRHHHTILRDSWGTHEHVERGLRNSIRRADLAEVVHADADAPDGARHVHDRLLPALLEEGQERLRDERGAHDVRLEGGGEVRRLEREARVEPTGVL